MRRILLYILLLLPSTLLHAQTVTNVDARQDGQNIVITFNMDKPADVSISYSTSGRHGPYFWVDSNYLSKRRISSTEYRYTWDVLGQCGDFSFNNVVFRVEAKEIKASSYFLSLGGFYSLNNDFGATFRFGNKVYVRFKTNFQLKEYFTVVNPSTIYFEDGSDAVNRWSALFGINWFLQNRISFYTGAGYGRRIFTTRATLGSIHRRYKIKENSATGLELECGLNLFVTEHFGFTMGYSVLAFKYSEFMGGVIFRW